jgi:hypothetical protein
MNIGYQLFLSINKFNLIDESIIFFYSPIREIDRHLQKNVKLVKKYHN